MTIVNSTELQNNFGKFLEFVQNGNDIVITRNGKPVARLISNERSVSFLSDSLVGVLQNDYDDKEIKNERMSKYESAYWY